jgi:DNA invertase Pin-like site-specific DNA recombinase
MTTLAYPYLRYSSGRQKEGDSERRQGEWFAEVCQREGWQIDRSFTLEDRGKSAFHGDHLKADLGRFLEAVNGGRVPRGSVLLVEELDRLDRRSRKTAMPFIMGILCAGISIRTRDRHYTEDSLDDLGDFIDITIKQGTANEESRKKSMRVGANWANWRARVANGERVPPPGRLPPWVRWRGGKFELVPEAAAAVQFIFRSAGDGVGMRRLMAALNDKDNPIPVIGRCPTWRLSYLSKLLCWRAVLGEVEDVTGAVHGGLYPAVVTEAEFYKARAALEGKRIGNKGVGRPGKGGPAANLFPGLLTSAKDGDRLFVIDKGAKGGGKFLVSSKALRHEQGSDPTPFPYPTFEQAVLSLLREVDPKEILGQTKAPDEVMVLSGKWRGAEDNVAAVNDALDAHGETPAMLARLHKREAERDRLAAELAAARARAAHPLSESWGECKSLLAAAAGEKGRLRLRAALRRVVDEARVLVVQRGRNERLAAVQFHFNGGACRSWLIWSRTFSSSGKARKAARWSARSFAEAGVAPGLDLRKRDHAVRLEKALLTLPIV